MKALLEHQRNRFLVVGGVNTAIDFGLLFVLKTIGVPILPSNIFSTTTAFVFSFFANKKYTFRSNGKARREFVLFTVVTLFGLWVLQSIVIKLILASNLLDPLDENLSLFIAKVAATVVTLIWNYVLYKNIVFNNERNV